MNKLGNRNGFFTILLMMVVMLSGLVRTGFAAPILTVSSSGGGIFVIRGTGIDNVGAMDITLTYDASTLALPRVITGGLISGALTAVNDQTPGTVRLGIIRVNPIQGSGDIATVTFTQKGNLPGKILSVTASFSLNANGKQVLAPVPAQIINPAAASADASGSEQKEHASQNRGASVTGGIPSTSSGGIIALGVGVAPGEKKDQPGPGAATMEQAGETVTASKTPSGGMSPESRGMTPSTGQETKKVQQVASVLDRFRAYSGNRTVEGLVALFDQREAHGFSQDPAVALSDGKTTVKIMFIVASFKGTTPDFALHGARLVSIKKDTDRSNTWVIEALPEKGEYAANLLVSQGDRTMAYPLTVSPKAALNRKKPGTPDAEFNRYLSGKRQDLNGDAKADYLDDYIATANFLTARQGRKDAPGKSVK